MFQAFLEANKLKLIIRSHEGPDARWKREGMQDMAKGHSLDHTTPGQQPTSWQQVMQNQLTDRLAWTCAAWEFDCIHDWATPKHLHNVETRFYCPQTFLYLDFQCRDDVSELK